MTTCEHVSIISTRTGAARVRGWERGWNGETRRRRRAEMDQRVHGHDRGFFIFIFFHVYFFSFLFFISKTSCFPPVRLFPCHATPLYAIYACEGACIGVYANMQIQIQAHTHFAVDCDMIVRRQDESKVHLGCWLADCSRPHLCLVSQICPHRVGHVRLRGLHLYATGQARGGGKGREALRSSRPPARSTRTHAPTHTGVYIPVHIYKQAETGIYWWSTCT